MSVRIDFYVLPDTDPSAKARFACRLAHKALLHGQRVHVHTQDADSTAALDALMWAYPSYQFLPHSRLDDANAVAAPVCIGHGESAAEDAQMLINLSAQIPAFFGRFERVAEIVSADTKAQMREHYRFYRDKGYALYHHELTQWEDQ